MKSVAMGLGLLLSSVSVTAMAGSSAVSIGSIGSGVQASTSGASGSNRVSISGDSIRLGSVSSVVGDKDGSSEISIGSITGAQENGRNMHSDSFECNDSANGISISGEGQTSEVDGSAIASMCISGENNSVTIANSDALELVSLSGVSNTVRLSMNTATMVLQLGGVRNRVYLPLDVNVQVIHSGKGNRVIRF